MYSIHQYSFRANGSNIVINDERFSFYISMVKISIKNN